MRHRINGDNASAQYCLKISTKRVKEKILISKPAQRRHYGKIRIMLSFQHSRSCRYLIQCILSISLLNCLLSHYYAPEAFLRREIYNTVRNLAGGIMRLNL